jgi:transposase
MSYVDALYDRNQDRIHVVERVNGERVYKEYPASYIFYYDDPRGKFRTVYGTPVSRFSSRSYKEFQKEMDMLNVAFAESMMQGDAKGRVFTFPIPTYNITEAFDWDNPNHEMIWQITAKYGTPYFSNFVNSDMNPEDARSMCCRLRIDNRDLQKRGGGLFGANPLTGSIGVVTINMPRLGREAKTKEEFFEKLYALMDLAKESLEIKRKILEKMTDVVGLYLNPPEQALVLCVDEKSQIQALDRTQPSLPLKKGRCGTMTHDYKRNGTTTLFAALNVLDGKVISHCQQRHTHAEWLKFLRKIDRETPKDKTLHLIADNYATHKHPVVQE